MKQGLPIIAALSFLGFCFLSQGLAYDAIRDIRLRIKKLEQDINTEEHALIRLHDRHRAILEEKKRLANYHAQRKEAIAGALDAMEERRRFLCERQKTEAQAKSKEKQKKLEFINQLLESIGN